MTKVEELQVLISANASQFKGELLGIRQDLQKLGRTSDTISSSMGGNLFGTILGANLVTSLFTTTVSRTTDAVTGLVGKLIEGGSAYSRLRVATDTVASNLGITSVQLKELRDDLEDANTWGINAENVIRTLALSGLVKMAEGLEAVDARTGKVVKGVTALTLAMKDLGAANAIDSSDAIERISKFIQRGETSFADGLIEIGEINREYAAYAKQVGKTTDTLSAQERAQVRLNVVMRESQKVYGAYANTYQTSGKALASIRDIQESLTQMIGSYLEPLLSVGSNAILQFFMSLRDMFQAGEGSIKNFAVNAAGYLVFLVRVLGRLLTMLPGIGQHFQNLANFSVKPIQPAKALGGAADNTRKKLSGMGGAMDQTSKAVGKLKKELADLAGFDEMNVLKFDDPKGSGADIGGGGIFDDMLDFGEMEDYSEEINGIADGMMDKFSGVLSFITGGLNGIPNILSTIGSELFGDNGFFPISKVRELTEMMFTDVNKSIKTHGPNVLANMMNLGTNIGRTMAPGYETAKQITNDSLDSIVKAWKENGGLITDQAGLALTNVTGIMNQLWTDIIDPIISPFLKEFQRLWDSTFKDVVDEGAQFVTKLIGVALLIYNKVIAPIVSGLLTTLKPAFEIFGQVAASVWGFFTETVGRAVGTVLKVLNGLLDFITIGLTQGWGKAFEFLGQKVGSVFEGIKNTFKNGFNWIIDKFNGFTRTVNGIKVDIPGIGQVGFNLPTIPRLAAGAEITGPTIAEIGEQGYNEVVLPLERNTGWAEKVAELINENRGGGASGAPIIINIGPKKIYEGFVDYANSRAVSSNQPIFNF